MDSQVKRWAVITGASSGIGYELAKEFGANGFYLLVTSEDSGLTEAVQAFQQLGCEVRSIRADLRTREGVEQLYARIKTLGPIDSICINAGVGVGGATFDKTSLEDELDLIRLNVMSVVHLTKLVLPDMLEVGHGRILFTSSIAAFLPGPYESVYAASKAFVQSFSEGIRQEVKDKGITVTALQPGPTETNFFHRAGMDDTKVGQQKKDDAEKVAKQGFKALMDGDDAVIAGSFSNKVQGIIAKSAPQTVAAKMHERLTKPNSKQDQK